MSAVRLDDTGGRLDSTLATSWQRLSANNRATLKALGIFFGVIAIMLPLTYLAQKTAAPVLEPIDMPPEQATPAPLQSIPVNSGEETTPEPAAEKTLLQHRLPSIVMDPRAHIISRVQALIDQEHYRRAVDVAESYLSTSELAELWRLRSLAHEKSLLVREQELRDELKSIPSRDLKLNRDKYAQLVAINPDEPMYHKKLAYYQDKYQEQQRKRPRR